MEKRYLLIIYLLICLVLLSFSYSRAGSSRKMVKQDYKHTLQEKEVRAKTEVVLPLQESH